MNIEEKQRGEITVLKFAGRITYGQGDRQLRERFGSLIEDGRRLFVLDLMEVPYLDSSGIGEVVACHDRARKRGGVVRVVLNERVQRLFSVYELERVFRIFPEMEDALASFAAPAFELVH